MHMPAHMSARINTCLYMHSCLRTFVHECRCTIANTYLCTCTQPCLTKCLYTCSHISTHRCRQTTSRVSSSAANGRLANRSPVAQNANASHFSYKYCNAMITNLLLGGRKHHVCYATTTFVPLGGGEYYDVKTSSCRLCSAGYYVEAWGPVDTASGEAAKATASSHTEEEERCACLESNGLKVLGRSWRMMHTYAHTSMHTYRLTDRNTCRGHQM